MIKANLWSLIQARKALQALVTTQRWRSWAKVKFCSKQKNGGQKVVCDVYYIPKLTSNILSIGQLLERGYKIHMEDCMLWLRDQEFKLVAKVPMTKNRMFLLNLKNGGAKCLKSCVDDSSWIWHMQFDHLNFGGLKALRDKKMVKGIPVIDHPDQVCEACLLGKHSRRSFPKQSTLRSTKPLQLLHFDVCGPIKPQSLGKSSYFMLFINGYSRKTWVNLLKRKSEAFDAFKMFKTSVEKLSGYGIKALRSDRGEFNGFCELQWYSTFFDSYQVTPTK